jgi:hypothetical protein
MGLVVFQGRLIIVTTLIERRLINGFLLLLQEPATGATQNEEYVADAKNIGGQFILPTLNLSRY